MDRTNLGTLASGAFNACASLYSPFTYTSEFPVRHPRRNAVDDARRVGITTVRRLDSMPKGDGEFGEWADAVSRFEAEAEALPRDVPPRR